MQQLVDPPKTWTFENLQQLLDDLQQLPDDVDWRRFEIVDGALVVSPSPDSLHELTIARLQDALRMSAPGELSVIGSLGIELAPSYRVPDIVVATRELLESRVSRLRPGEAVLVVEVVSAGSRTTDRVTKPAQYAAAGIPGFWRVETDPEITLTASALDAGAQVYTEIGTWHSGQTAEIDRPFPVTIRMDELVPRA